MTRLFIALFTLSLLAPAKSDWTVARSPHFELYATSSAGEAKRVLRHFETVQGFFARLLGRDSHSRPIRIVVFNGEKEFARFRPSEVAAAYFWAGASCDWIVMGDWTEHSTATAVHEYMHLLLHAPGVKVPLWLDEGLAEVYSTLEPRGNKVMVGAMKPYRMNEVQTGKWIPVADVIAAGHDSPLYNKKDKAGMLYGQAWLLTHMMMMEPDFGPKFGAFLNAVLGGMDSVEAIQKIYGRSLKSLDEELKGYLTSQFFRAALYDYKLEPSREKIETAPAADYDWRMVVAELVRDDDVSTRDLEQLRAEYTDRPEAPAALAYKRWRQGNSKDAARLMTEALNRGSRNSRLLWDCARFTAGDDNETSVKATQLLLEIEPNRLEAKLHLARLHLHAGRSAQAYSALEGVRAVNPELAPDLFELLAQLALKRGDYPEATKSLNRLTALKSARPDQLDHARRTLAWLASVEARSKAPAEIAEAPRPTLRRDVLPPPDPGQPGPATTTLNLTRVEGKFRQLLCAGDKAWMVVATADKKLSLLLDDPSMVTIKGRASATLDLQCGPQRNEPVRVGFISGEDHDVDGFVREIEWLKLQ